MPAPYAEPSFESLRLSQETLQALREMGFHRPTPVQVATYTPIVEGRDLMIQAQSGSGKTPAYGIPLAEMLNPLDKRVQALVLVPSREIANQAAEALVRIFAHRELSVAAVYGGAGMGGQIAELKSGVQVVVGTPERVLDHLQRKTLRLDGLRVLVLDEAKEMLSLGFARALHSLLEFTPKERQSLIFSPSLSEDIQDLGGHFLVNPEKISIADRRAEPKTTHEYYLVSGVGKHRDLVRLIRFLEAEQGVIFCNTFEDVHFLTNYLRRKGISTAEFTQDLSPNEREKVLQKIKRKELRFLIANTTAAQWIDAGVLAWGANYGIPESPEDYLQRASRIGRAGQGGAVVSVVAPQDLGNFITIRKVYKLEFLEKTLPSEEELEERDIQRRFQTLLDKLSKQPYTAKQEATAQYLLADPRGPQLLAALLAHLEAKPVAAPPPPASTKDSGAPAPVRPEPESPPAPPSLPLATGESWEDVPLLKLSPAPLRAQSVKSGPAPKAPTAQDGPQKETPPAPPAPPAGAGPASTTGQRPSPRSRSPRPAPAPKAVALPVKEKVTPPEEEQKQEQSGAPPAAPPPAAPLPPESKKKTENGALAPSALEAPSEEPREAPQREPLGAVEEGAPVSAEPPAEEPPKETSQAPSQEEPTPKAPPSLPPVEAAPVPEESSPKETEEEVATPTNGENEEALAGEEGEEVRMTRLYLNLGRRDDIRASEVTRFLRDHIKLTRRDLGRVQVRDTYCHIGVRAELAEDVIKALSGQKFKDKEVVVEIARGRE